MKRTLTSIAILSAIVAVLAATNPSEKQFRSYMEQTVESCSPRDTWLDRLGARILSETVSLDTRGNVRTEDYFILSVFTYQGMLTGGKPVTFLGIANQFVHLDRG